MIFCVIYCAQEDILSHIIIDKNEIKISLYMKGKKYWILMHWYIETEIDTVANKEFLKCEYNRDGDSYRSPWTNKYFP